MRLVFALAAVLFAASQATAGHLVPAGQGGSEARWCWVSTPALGNVQWDCRYRTLAECARALWPRSDSCLANPNWYLRGARRNVRWVR